jgi:prepilin-type N-terminal cleavage/methylation domain-containing protein
MTTVKTKKAFTLIELLVVIAIIALLLAIIIPTLTRAREIAKTVMCRSNLRQLGILMSIYGSENSFDHTLAKRQPDLPPAKAEAPYYQKSWLWHNGTADYAHENNRMKNSLMSTGLVDSHKIFFCPSVRNLSADKNYNAADMNGGTPDSYNTEQLLNNPATDPAFWSSYVWVYKKEVWYDVVSVNGGTKGVMMLDMTRFCWRVIKTDDAGSINLFGRSIENLHIGQTVEHYNVLMDDLSVDHPTDKDKEMNPYLWSSDKWAGRWD